MAKKKSSGTPATVALEFAGIAFEVRAYDHDPSAESFGMEAAELLGVDAAKVFKTLLAQTDDGLVVAVVPVSGMLDLKALAATVGSKKVTMAGTVAAQRSSGYVVGGISPIGQRKPLPTVLDDSALRHTTILVSGGRRGLDLELTPADLMAVSGATLAPIGRH